jgi:hypothetical protein
MYSLHLYCSESSCSAVYVGEGPLEALHSQVCAFCGAALEPAAWPPAEFSGGGRRERTVRLTLLQEPLGLKAAPRSG